MVQGRTTTRRLRKFTFLASMLTFWSAVIAVPCILVAREVRQQQLNQQMLNAVKREDFPAAIRALDLGADANARDSRPLSLKQLIWNVLIGKKRPSSSAPTAMLIELQWRYAPFDDMGSVISRKVPAEFISALLTHGANINATDADGHPALWHALMARKGTLSRVLIDHGASVTGGPDPNELLYRAVWHSNYVGAATVEKMLDRGADPNSTYQRLTVLGMAIELSNVPIVRALLKHHADPNRLSDVYGQGLRLPLEIADAGCRQEPQASPPREIIALLRAAGARRFRVRQP